MTENEALNTLQYLIGYENAVDKGEIDTPNYLNSQEKESLIYLIEQLQKYRSIGTVEECEKYKRSCIVGVVKFDKEQLQSIVDEKVKDIELDIQKIRNCAIDEFSKISMEEFTKFDLEHGYPTIADVKTIVRDVQEKLKR